MGEEKEKNEKPKHKIEKIPNHDKQNIKSATDQTKTFCIELQKYASN